MQSQHFLNELKVLSDHEDFDLSVIGNAVSGKVLKHSSLPRLSPVVICGVLRLGGRVVVSNLPLDTKFLILLPNRSRITFLIVKFYHVKEGHAGVMHTLASVRERFWVLKDVSFVRKAIKESRVRRIAFAKPGSQVMSRCLGIKSRLAGQLLLLLESILWEVL